MLKKIIFGVVITLALGAGVFWFFYTEKINAPISNAISAIPTDASVIVESKKINSVWKKISETNIIWEELLGINSVAQLKNDILSIDSLLKENKDISDVLNNHSVFISFHQIENKNFELLTVFSLPDLTYQNKVDDFLKNANGGKEIVYENYQEEKLGVINHHYKIYFSCIDGTLVFSKNKNLLQKSIIQFKNGKSITANKDYLKIINSAGKSVDASVFVNYKNLSLSISSHIGSSKKGGLKILSAFSDFSGWDISIKPNAVLCNGFTYANDSINNFLSVFKNQTPQKLEIAKVLPSKSVFFVTYGISNKQLFFTNYENYLSPSAQKKQNQFFETNNSRYAIDLKKEMRKCVDNELAFVITENKEEGQYNSFAILHSADIEGSEARINMLNELVSQKDEIKSDSTHYKSHALYHLVLNDLLTNSFGNIFESIDNGYYTTLDNYIVFSNSFESLKYFIDEFESNKTLSNDKNYKMFSDNTSSDASFYLYSSISKSIGLYSDYLSEELKQTLLDKKELFKKFEAFSVQFSTSSNNLFYSNIYLKYNPEFKKETETLWELPLDTTFSSRPYIVINHNTKAKEIFLQDDANKIYLISNTGKILWTKQLSEKIMGDVVQLDVYKNDKLQMVFNTRSYIYMFDRNGNEMKGFPLKLKSPATNSVSVIDYENNKDYRLFIATANKRVVCYKPNAEQVTAFGFDKTNDEVFLPIYFFNTNSKDHICFVDVKGKVYIVNRQGEKRIDLKEKLPQGIRNYFLDIGKDYSKSSIVAADTLGKIVKISLTGNKENTVLQNFETSPYFEFRDLNNDKIKEYILLTRNELKVFSQDKTLLFKHEFEEKISHPPLVFTFKDGTSKIGVVSDLTNQLFLFDENGQFLKQFPLTGNTFFGISDLNNQGVYNLVTGSSERAIYVYQLQ